MADQPSQGGCSAGDRVTGASSSLGGVANVGFEDEEDVVSTDHVHLEEEEEGDPDDLDAGYSRVRKVPLIDNEELGGQPTEEDTITVTEEFKAHREEFQRESKQRSSRRFPKVQKPMMFFVHGVGGSADTWTMQIAHFAEMG